MESETGAASRRSPDHRPAVRERRRRRDRAPHRTGGHAAPSTARLSLADAPAIILLAEDDSEVRAIVAHVLRSDGYEVIEAASTIELFDYLAAISFFGSLLEDAIPDLILSDVQLPGGACLDLLSGLYQSAYPIPYVLMTALADEDLRVEAIRRGASLVLDKPFNGDRLRATVRQIVG
jgi:two-component system, response regulator, stage 0 sporulation protein F